MGWQHFEAAFTIGDKGYFLHKGMYLEYQWGTGTAARAAGQRVKVDYVRYLMPDLPDDFQYGVVAALGSDPAHIYLVKGGNYVVYDISRRELERQPQPLCGPDGLFSDIPAGTIVTGGASFQLGGDRNCYLFTADGKVYQGDLDSGSVEGPEVITQRWPLLGSNFGETVQCAIPSPGGEVLYVFNGDMYAEIDPIHNGENAGAAGNKNRAPASYQEEDWPGMRRMVFDRPGGTSFPAFWGDAARPTFHVWGAGGGGGAAGGSSAGGHGGGGAYLRADLAYYWTAPWNALWTDVEVTVGSGGAGAADGSSGGVGGQHSLIAVNDPAYSASWVEAGGGGGGGSAQGGRGGDGGAGGSSGSRAHDPNGGGGGGSLQPNDLGAAPENGGDGTGAGAGSGGNGGGNGGAGGGYAAPGQSGPAGGVGGQGASQGGAGGSGGRGISTGGGGGGSESTGGGGGGAGGSSAVTAEHNPPYGQWGWVTGLGASGQLPNARDVAGYESGAGCGGNGAAGAGSGRDGGDGLVIITW